MKLLSVGIPCYNSAAYMANAIESCLVLGDDIEIIVVDDGSRKDNTLEIGKAYEAQYPGIVKCVHQENGGHGEAVNAGLRNATGMYYKVVDSDDWLDEESLCKVIDAFSKDIICFIHNRINKSARTFSEISSPFLSIINDFV